MWKELNYLLRRPLSVLLVCFVLSSLLMVPASASTFQEGLHNYFRENFEKARRKFQQAVQANPRKPKYHFFLGNVFNRLDDVNQAELAYKKALELDTTYTTARRRLAFLYFNSRQWKEAAAQFKHLLSSNPQNFEYRFHYGVVLFKQGKYELARGELLRAREIRPEAAEAHYYLGRISLDRGQKLNSISRFARAIELDPSTGKYYFYRGVAYFRNEDYRAAPGARFNSAQNFRKAVELEFSLSRSRFMLGNSLLSRGLYLLRQEKAKNGIDFLKRSVQQFRFVLLDDARASNAYHNMGIAYLGIGKLELARQAFREAIGIEPSVAFFHDSLGLAHYRLGNFKQALSSWTFVHEIDSDYSGHPFKNLLGIKPLDKRLREARIRN